MKVVVCVEPGCGRATCGAIAAADSLAVQGWHVVWLSAGPELYLPTHSLRPDEHLQITDPCLKQIHAQSLATVLAKAVVREMPTLVLTGARSDGRGRGLMPAALAEALRWTLFSHVSSVVPGEGGQHLDVWLEGASQRMAVRAALPAVIACLPSHPVAASRPTKPAPTRQTVVTVTELGIHPRSLRRDQSFSEEPVLVKPTTVHSAAALWQALAVPPATKG